MIVVLAIAICIIAYFTWRISVAILRLNNMLGAVLDAILNIAGASPQLGADEMRQILKGVAETFYKENPLFYRRGAGG